MSKKNYPDPATLRTAADVKVATWRELEAVAAVKRQACKDFKPQDPDRWGSWPNASTRDKFACTTLEIEALRAQEPADRAAHAAALALDAVELAEGDELALARDPKRLHDDLVALAAEEAEILRQLEDVRNRRVTRQSDAVRSDAAYWQRREAAGLPTSARIPQPTHGDSRDVYLRRLLDRAEHGSPVPSKSAQIEAAEGERLRFAAELEEQRIAKEKHEKEIEWRREARSRDEQDAQRREHKAREERNLEHAEMIAKRGKLAADYIARQGG